MIHRFESKKEKKCRKGSVELTRREKLRTVRAVKVSIIKYVSAGVLNFLATRKICDAHWIYPGTSMLVMLHAVYNDVG